MVRTAVSTSFPDLADRRISAILGALTSVEPVIAIHGPRAVGKSPEPATFAAARGVPVLDLDDLAVRDAVVTNPALAVGGAPPVCIDEYPRAPEVLDAIKARWNREGSVPGLAVTSGSTRQDALPRIAQALTGRLHALTSWPLSQGEISGITEDPLVALRDDPDGAVAAHPTSATTRVDYVERVVAGGFPLAVRRSGAGRSRWFDDYATQSIERDALELARVRQRQILRELLARLAGRTAQVLDLTKASQRPGRRPNHDRAIHTAPRGSLLSPAVAGLGEDVARPGSSKAEDPRHRFRASCPAHEGYRVQAGVVGCNGNDRVRESLGDLRGRGAAQAGFLDR